MTKNHYNISKLVPAELKGSSVPIDDIVQGELAGMLAAAIAEDFPVTITPAPLVKHTGETDFVHTLDLFIFSEQQLQEYINQAVKTEIFNRAADNALRKLPERLAN